MLRLDSSFVVRGILSKTCVQLWWNMDEDSSPIRILTERSIRKLGPDRVNLEPHFACVPGICRGALKLLKTGSDIYVSESLDSSPLSNSVDWDNEPNAAEGEQRWHLGHLACNFVELCCTGIHRRTRGQRRCWWWWGDEPSRSKPGQKASRSEVPNDIFADQNNPSSLANLRFLVCAISKFLETRLNCLDPPSPSTFGASPFTSPFFTYSPVDTPNEFFLTQIPSDQMCGIVSKSARRTWLARDLIRQGSGGCVCFCSRQSCLLVGPPTNNSLSRLHSLFPPSSRSVPFALQCLYFCYILSRPDGTTLVSTETSCLTSHQYSRSSTSFKPLSSIQ